MLARSLIFNALLYLNFIVQAVIFSPVLLLPERYVWPIARFWVRSCLWLHRTVLGIGHEIRGRENIPAGSYIVASKHQSAWETLQLVELFPRPCFILKRQLLWLPLFGWYLARTGMVPVDRGKGAEALEAMTARARRAIAEGRQIIIFPEGTRRPPLAPPNLPLRRDAAVSRPWRPVPAGGAEFRPLLAPALADAAARHDPRRDPAADPAGAAAGGICGEAAAGDRKRNASPDGRGICGEPAAAPDRRGRTRGSSVTMIPVRHISSHDREEADTSSREKV